MLNRGWTALLYTFTKQSFVFGIEIAIDGGDVRRLHPRNVASPRPTCPFVR